MSSLAAGFVTRMRKLAGSSHGETTPRSKVPGNKRLKQSDPDGEAQNNSAIIVVDSPKWGLGHPVGFGGCNLGGSHEA